MLVRRAAGAEVLLITVSKRVAFYERCGFAAAAPGAAIPAALAAERAVGSVYAGLVAGERLVVMRRPAGDASSGAEPD